MLGALRKIKNMVVADKATYRCLPAGHHPWLRLSNRAEIDRDVQPLMPEP
jgi:hypothetical protein